jgi:hypothetical protein
MHSSKIALFFLVQLNQRSLCLDIASSLLSEEWLWERHLLAASSRVSEVMHDGLLEGDVDRLVGMLVARCADVAATVRSRALGALYDLLESTNISSGDRRTSASVSQLAARMHTLVMGETMARGEDADVSKKSLLSTLRELVVDEKALVRVKAIQAIGTCDY